MGNFPRHTLVRDFHMALEQNYAGNEQKSYRPQKQIFATLDKAIRVLRQQLEE
jgi:hypothetical protein